MREEFAVLEIKDGFTMETDQVFVSKIEDKALEYAAFYTDRYGIPTMIEHNWFDEEGDIMSLYSEAILPSPDFELNDWRFDHWLLKVTLEERA